MLLITLLEGQPQMMNNCALATMPACNIAVIGYGAGQSVSFKLGRGLAS